MQKILRLLISNKNSLYQAIRKEKATQQKNKCFICVYRAKNMNKQSTEDIQITYEHLKRFSTSLVIQEIQKKKMRNYFYMQTGKKILRLTIPGNINGEKDGHFIQCWWERKLLPHFCKNLADSTKLIYWNLIYWNGHTL